MPRVSDGSSWSVEALSNSLWHFFNVAYLFFRTLIDPLVNIGSGSGNMSSSRSRTNPGGPPRPPRRGFATFSDTIASPGSFPPAGG